MKSIIFNTEYVRDILDGRKTVMRIPIKPPALDRMVIAKCGMCLGSVTDYLELYPTVDDCKYQVGDCIWVREIWSKIYGNEYPNGMYVYRARDKYPFGKKYIEKFRWYPSSNMPREAARIFLMVTDVGVERLQDIDTDSIIAEGGKYFYDDIQNGIHKHIMSEKEISEHMNITKYLFGALWDRTIKPADRVRYGWDANPWVWVISFERISKEEAENDT